jgi:hypothetical protein
MMHDRKTVPRPNLFLFRRGDYRNKDHNTGSLFWVVQVLVKVVLVAQKQSTIEQYKE